MLCPSASFLGCLSVLLTSAAASAGREAPTFIDETALRLPAAFNAPAIGVADDSERSYSYGDIDRDGDLDLVVSRRPAYQFGFRTNVLFMNEGVRDGHKLDGVLVNRSSELAAASDLPGFSGFLTPTSDRDIAMVDLDGDLWLDVVTAPAWNVGQPKHLSHPRVYRNLGEINGVWQGLRYEDSRIPLMHPTEAPRFSAVSARDVDGDGDVDLFFSDFDNSESPLMLQGAFDYNNRLLQNDGQGYFTDVTATAMTPAMSNAAYGTSATLVDVNGDGAIDIVRDSANLNPVNVAVIYNDPANPGVFTSMQTVYGGNPYHISSGDLNGDGRVDLIVTDNNTDRYLLNVGNDAQGHAQFVAKQFPFIGFDFGGNSYASDLDLDGQVDVLITDMDVDVPGCFRRTHIYRNNGNPPDVTFTETNFGIPTAKLMGTHDAAIFDINGDGWPDMVLGRCNSSEIWIAHPPSAACPEDLDASGAVDGADLGLLLSQWQLPGSADLNHDGAVDGGDLGLLLARWGACPGI